ncbi:lamin tail domain-containing protein [Chloroflexota bacterium]
MACEIAAPGPSVTEPATQPPANVEDQTPPEISPPEQTADEVEWSIVQIFTGKESETTPPFHISGTEWRIFWTADAQSPEYAVFDIFVYPQGKEAVLTKLVSYSEGTSSDTVYIYEGGCDYYLKVIAANLSNWTITVEGYEKQEFNCPVQITKINYKGKDYTRTLEAGHSIVEYDEYVEIKNESDSPQNIAGWMLKNITKRAPEFVFPTLLPCSCAWYSNFEVCVEKCYQPHPCVIEPRESIRVYTGDVLYESGGFNFNYFPGDIWNNETPDTAVLYNLEGQEVSRKSYVISTGE